MRHRLVACVFWAAAALVSCSPGSFAQSPAPSAAPIAQAGLQCPRAITRPPSVPKVEISDLTFEGSSGMPVADQDQIAASLRRQIYDGDVEAVTSELEERVRRAWQEHGYFHVKVRGKVTKLASSPAKSRIAASFELDEGPQFRLAGITFKGDTAVIDPGSLRSLFPMEDGDVFDTTQVAKGLEELSQAYGQLGYINSTAIPETQISDEHRTISLNVDIDEGKQFLVSNIRVVGLDEDASQNLLTGFLLKAGDAYNQKLLELSMERLAVPQSAMSYELQRNERAGTVAVSIRFVRCP